MLPFKSPVNLPKRYWGDGVDFHRYIPLKDRALGRKGSALLQVLGAVAFLSAGFYALSTYVIQQKSQILRNTSIVQLRLALQSTVDYGIYGIRQKWCFHPTLQQDSSCTLKHDGNVERVVMSAEQENFIRELIANGIVADPGGAISLAAIDRYVDFGSITASHPLFTIMSRLKQKDKDDLVGIKLHIQRDDSPQLPRAGREVFLSVTASFQDGPNSAPLRSGGHVLAVTSYISVHPREVGSFALVVPKDLRLDKSFNANLVEGDVTFHQFAGVGAVNGPGLKFLSPVFVNRNFYLPRPATADERTESTRIYTPVTFADKVILGNGAVYEGENLYVPATAGGLSARSWSDNKLFGGLQKGIENDGAVDLGLDYYSHHGTEAGVDSTMMAQCIQRNLQKSTYDAIRNSQIYATARSGFGSQRGYRLWMSDGNEFSPQANELKDPIMGNWDGGSFSRVGSSKIGGVVRVSLAAGSYSISTDVPVNGSVEIGGPTGAFGSESKLLSEVQKQTGRQQDAQKDVDDLTGSLASKTADRTAKKNKLKDEEAKPPASQNSGLIASLKSDIADLDDQISTIDNDLTKAKDKLDKAKTALDAANEALTNYQQMKANPAKIAISVEGVHEGGYDQPNKVNVDVKVTNGSSLRDSDGSQVSTLTISLLGMDPTFNYGSSSLTGSERMKHTSSMTATLKASYDSATKGFNLPGKSLLSDGTVHMAAEDMTNYGELDKACSDNASSSGSAAFGFADWDYSFAKNARSSWNFAGNAGAVAGSDPMVSDLSLDETNSSSANLPVVFQVRSIANNCIIKPGADFVTGFYGCNNLIIQARSTPLRIIGTFIASKAVIDPSAYRYGITWSSIYHPQSVYELRRMRTLRTQSGEPCQDVPASPIWHPIPSMVEVANRFSCNVISLRAKADPFQWTSVDPDCGLLPGKSSTSCKKRVTRFLVIEHSRESGL